MRLADPMNINGSGHPHDLGMTAVRCRPTRKLHVITLVSILLGLLIVSCTLPSRQQDGTKSQLKQPPREPSPSVTQQPQQNIMPARAPSPIETLQTTSPSTKTQPPSIVNSSQTLEQRRLGEICGLPLLIQAIRNDTEHNSLRTLSFHNVEESSGNRYNYSLDGVDNHHLLEEAFHGKRTFFFGDSTLFYFTKWLNIALRGGDQSCPATPENNLPSSSLSQANAYINKQQSQCFKNQPGVRSAERPTTVNLRNGATQIQWAGYAGSYGNIRKDALHRILQTNMTAFQPHILVFNLGLHILHFAGEARDPSASIVHLWIHYEDMLQAVLDAAAAAKSVQLVLFKTTNFVCVKQFQGAFATATARYHVGNAATLANCGRIVRKLLEGQTEKESDEDIARFCRHAPFSEDGVLYLNHRLRNFLKYHARFPAGLDVGLFNDHDMQSCAYTTINDGRHYHGLNLARIRMMANHFQCYLKRESFTG